MGIAIYVENLIHQRTEQVKEDPPESIMRLCEAAPMQSVLGSIARYGDTMLNVIQMRRLIEELSEVKDPEYQAPAAKLSEAAERAIRLRGYLYFVGD